jgi:hypothetical protein
MQYEHLGIRFIAKAYEFMNAFFGYGRKELQLGFNKRSCCEGD